jgi:hypothetical protein
MKRFSSHFLTSFRAESFPKLINFSSRCFTSKHASPSQGHSTADSSGYVIGEQLGHVLDMSTAHIGQTIEIPYEQTIGESQSGLWQSTFQTHDRLYTSAPFAQSLQLQSHVLPYSLVLFQTISMAHVDESREVLDLGFERAVYIRPAFAGDTLRQTFMIKHLRNTSDGKNTIVTVGCELHNQRNQLIFSVDKIMLYPMITHPYKLIKASTKKEETARSHLLAHILYNADALPHNSNLALIKPKQLILHSVSRPIGKSANMALSTLFRWSHPVIYNMKRYKDEELVVTGGLVLAAALSASSRGLFETMHETIEHASFLNKVSPVDLIGAFTYIHNIKSIKDGFEEIDATTVGTKNIDVARELAGVKIPVELFTNRMKPHELEEFLKQHVPVLSEKCVVHSHRKIVRQSPYGQHRAIPLL